MPLVIGDWKHSIGSIFLHVILNRQHGGYKKLYDAL